jgi:Fe-S cluster biogenesis protein NfuA/nitrite reductase/ring-hydroxylating ferredoxin subunit
VATQEQERTDDPSALIERIERLTADLERIRDPGARAGAEELVASILELYGEGLARIGEALNAAGPAGEPIKNALVEDGVVASLLLIHGLYPVDLETRVREALDEVRPYMESHGGNVELVGVSPEGVAHLRLEGHCDGCPASRSTLELAIKDALDQTAPDLAGLEVEGLVEESPAGPLSAGAFELPIVQSGLPAGAGGGAPPSGPRTQAGPTWVRLEERFDDLADGTTTGIEVLDRKVVVARVEGKLLAYLDECPSCESALAGVTLSEGVLTCPSCDRRYFLPRAGRSLDEDKLQLGPVPLLNQNGAGIKVAVPA